MQLVWGKLPVRDMVLEIDGRPFEIGGPPPGWYRATGRPESGPGSLHVEGLEPATDYQITLAGDGRPRKLVAVARTAPPPPGPVLARFATLSDCHIGERRFGAVKRMRDPGSARAGLAPYPLRALRAACAEARAWGARHLVARGDVTRHGTEAEAELVAQELIGTGLPVAAVLGNHDVAGRTDVAAVLERAGVVTGRPDRPAAVDLPGVRLVMGHTPIRHQHGGRLTPGHLDRLVGLAADSPGPVAVVLHHPPRAGGPPTYYPPGLPPADSRLLARRLAEVNPSTMVLSGHTHRTRYYQVGPLAVSEVGSTKDYPGQWAGYTVFEGGLAQVARRIAAPDVIAWTEMTGRALGGQWARWSPGGLSDRSWLHEWPDPVPGRGQG